MIETNWAGNHAYSARRLHAPATIEELRDLVSRTRHARVLGSRHSFTGIADSDELVSLERLPRGLSIDRAAMTVTVSAAVRYGELARELDQQGLALANLASLSHISVAGAISTATHGSGDRNGNLATAVAALEIVTADGSLLHAARGDADFDGLVVGLGAVGAVTAVTLDVEPAYEVRQWVFENLGWEALFEHFDELTSSGYSVSAFTRWGDAVDQVWIKTRGSEPGQLFDASRATVNRHPVPGADPVHCTPQLGERGPWHERLPHFRMGFTPSSGDEIQSEYIVARRDGVAAIQALRGLSAAIRPLIQVGEIRTVAADSLWMSPQYERDAVAIHFTWRPAADAVERVLGPIERTLAAFDARPHWGKVFVADAAEIGPRYPRRAAFRSLLERLDPRGVFRNDWLAAHVLGEG